ncbi:MAG: glucosyltransferase domain-containing protein [Treponema sp.]|nr:glucosyltransferase domain-containing protein [Treponema sp.]
MKEVEKPFSPGQRIWRYGVCFFSCAGILCSTAVLFPEIQYRIIHLAERYLIHRKVNFYAQWMHTLSVWAKGCLSLIVIFDFFTLSKKGRALFREIAEELKIHVSKINFSLFARPFLFVSGVYLFGYTSIIRANFSYVDDLARAIEGYHGWNGWSRHLADILSTFIHADPNLTDISPLPQILAALIIGACTVLLVYILCNGEFSFTALLAGVSLGLFPYFLENISYKFDAPYMAISIFFSVVPFIFTGSKKAFVFSSIVSLLIMCMTYQAASGIYIVLTITLCYRDWNYKKRTHGEILSFAADAAFSFCFAMIFFRLIFMLPSSGSGLSTEMLPPDQLVRGTLLNWKNYITTIHSDFGLIWKILIVILCVLFMAQAAGKSSHKKFFAFIVSFVFIVTSFFLSYGAYFLLKNPSYAPRALFGFGVFTAVISICIASGHSKPAALCVFLLNWSFMVFAFSYGNALADQKRYTDFRVEILLHDLSSLFPSRDKAKMSVDLENMIGFGPVTENISEHYPVIKRLVPVNRYYHVYVYMSEYFHWGRGTSETSPPPPPSDMPVVLDSYYHTVKSDGEHIRVLFKH